MRSSREEASQNRERIVTAAGKLFRERGIGAVAVAEVMQAAGMTHGGFYKHFASKDELAAEALEAAMHHTGAGLRAAAEQAAQEGGNNAALRIIADRYLTERHRARPGEGCAIAALSGELVHSGGPARRALHAGRERLTALVRGYFTGAAAAERASAFVSTMTGALIAARLAPAAEGVAILEAARRELHRRIEEQG
jgi:TetR/AcrR family transcriptional repressor of nem operon